MSGRSSDRADFMNSLSLVGDSDDVDLLVGVEATFGITISDGEASRLRTVGDLFELVHIKAGSGSTCLAGRAFLRLRDDASGGPRIRPSTPVAALAGSMRGPEWCRAAGARTGLDLDVAEWPPAIRLAATVLGALPFAIPLVWALAGPPALWLLGSWLLLALLVRAAPSRLPADIASVGDVVRRSMGRNYAALAARAGPGNRADLWLALCGTLRDATGHAGRIDRDTTFFRGAWDR